MVHVVSTEVRKELRWSGSWSGEKAVEMLSQGPTGASFRADSMSACQGLFRGLLGVLCPSAPDSGPGLNPACASAQRLSAVPQQHWVCT